MLLKKMYTLNNCSFVFLFTAAVFCILFFHLNLDSKAEILLSKDLPKTKDTVEEDSSSEEEKIDPGKIYKLVAVYLIGRQPRVLLKNTEVPEEGAKEYQVGDYLDELQTLSISRISFNPTARIEITDQNGLNYIIKPQSVESKAGSNTASKGYGKSASTYFTGGSSKTKTKKTSVSEPVAKPPSESSPPVAQIEKREEEKKKEVEQNTGALQAASKAGSSASPSSEGQTKIEGAKAPSMSQDEGLGVNRPSNPFGSGQ